MVSTDFKRNDKLQSIDCKPDLRFEVSGQALCIACCHIVARRTSDELTNSEFDKKKAFVRAGLNLEEKSRSFCIFYRLTSGIQRIHYSL